MSWEDKIRKVEPYVAGEQPKEKNIIKLNTNECPYPPAPGVEEAVRRLAGDSSALRLYRMSLWEWAPTMYWRSAF